MDDVSRQHLESGLAQIEVNLARKRERATEDGEQFPAKGGDDFYTAKHGPNGQTAENIQSAKIGIISMETKEAKRLKGSKKTEKAGLREKVQLKRSKKTEKMRKDEQAKLKERKSHKGRKAKSLGQQDDDNINENPEDISMLDQSIAVHQLPKPNKETRIVPMKVGDFWEYITLGESGQKSKEPPQEKNSPLSISSTLPMKRGLISSTETEYGSNETRRKRTKTATGDEMIPTPTPRARRKQPPGEFESQHGKTLVQIGKELTDDQNGAQSPSCSNATSGTSSSWSDSPLIDALRASLGHNEVHGDGTLDSGRGTTLKDEYKQVPDTWQEYPGKIRGRLETSEDLEVEESKQLYSRFNLPFMNLLANCSNGRSRILRSLSCR